MAGWDLSQRVAWDMSPQGWNGICPPRMGHNMSLGLELPLSRLDATHHDGGMGHVIYFFQLMMFGFLCRT